MCLGEGYRIQENTADSSTPSVNAVIDLALERAANLRSTEHSDSHFDQYISDAIEQFAEEDVVACIRLTLADGYTHRMAGTAAFGEDDYVWGINVGVAAISYLRELHQQQASERGS